MINELSVLIPTYNEVCLQQVEFMLSLLKREEDLQYEIIVLDDGSKDNGVIAQNKQIGDLPNCRYIASDHNQGRSVSRNILSKEGRYQWQLFLDASLTGPDDFITVYRNEADDADLVCGGVTIIEDSKWSENLRYTYERASAHRFVAAERNKQPGKAFRSTNFLVKKSVMEKCGFPENVQTYGYEDVIFGRIVFENGCRIKHIDNGIYIDKFENNPRYVEKIEESMMTLAMFEDTVGEYSPILQVAQRFFNVKMATITVIGFRLVQPILRWTLTRRRPHLRLLSVYKLGVLLIQLKKWR